MSDWRTGELGDLATGIRGVSYTPDQLREFKGLGTVTLLRANNIQGGRLNFNGTQIVPRGVVSDGQIMRVGDIAVCMSNGSKALVGKAAPLVADIGESLTVGAFCSIFRPTECADPGFVKYLFQSADYRKQLDWSLAGSAINNLRNSEMQSFRISVPPADEQREIAEILDTLDTSIRQTEAIIEKLKQVKQGLLHDLLTRGIDANGELRAPRSQAPHLYKNSPLGWIPREWTPTPLGELAEVNRGKFTHRPRNDPAFYGGRYPFIQTGDVANAAGGYVSTYSQTLSERGIAVSQVFPVGTVAITIAANIADTAILAVPMYFPDSVVGAIVAPSVNTRFVELSIRRAKPRLNARAPQSAQKNINLQDLRPMLVAVPGKAEQDAIAARYEAVQRRIDAEAAAARKLRETKSGLMDDLLTGRVRVTPLLDVAAPA